MHARVILFFFCFLARWSLRLKEKKKSANVILFPCPMIGKSVDQLTVSLPPQTSG